MRLEPIPPDRLTGEQREFHEEMSAAIAEHLPGFVSARADGALVGPFAPLLHFPAWGRPVWEQSRSMMTTTVLPGPAHEVAILVTGAALGARYELYAHQHVAERARLTPSKAATITAGQRPPDLDAAEGAAYDVAAALMRGGPLPATTYAAAQQQFGADGTAELLFLVGSYSLLSALLNGFDVPVPGDDEGTDR